MRKITVFILFNVLFWGQITVFSQNIDIDLLTKINQVEFTHDFSTFVSDSYLTVSIGVPVLVTGISLFKKDDALFKKALYMVASAGVCSGLTQSFKYAVNRPRPRISYPDRIMPFEWMSDKSFPSGHTSAAFNTATSLTLTCPKWYVAVPSFLWASSVGYSRMNLGVHYPSDVLFGAIIGSASAILTWKINDWFWKTQNNKAILTTKTTVWW